jgi:hypothetical protein
LRNEYIRMKSNAAAQRDDGERRLIKDRIGKLAQVRDYISLCRRREISFVAWAANRPAGGSLALPGSAMNSKWCGGDGSVQALRRHGAPGASVGEGGPRGATDLECQCSPITTNLVVDGHRQGAGHGERVFGLTLFRLFPGIGVEVAG